MADAAAFVPIQVHLCVHGARDAIGFYEKAFGAKEVFSMPTPDNRRLMHASLEMFGGCVLLHDDFPEHDGDVAPPTNRKPAAAVNVNLREPPEVDAAIARAVDAGAVITMAPADQFWGARYGRVRDPFGHVWAFHALLPNQIPEASKRSV